MRIENFERCKATDEVTVLDIGKKNAVFYDYSFTLHLIFLVSECLSICVDALL